MTTLALTASDFARECLNWPDALHGSSGAATVFRRGAPVSKRFCFTDLNAVMKSVQGWVVENELRGYLSITRHGFCFSVHRRSPSGEVSRDSLIATECNASACHALLAACVQANRKLKAA